MEAGIGQFVPAAGDAVAAFPAMSLRSGDSAEHAEEEVGGSRFVYRRDFERGLHRDVFEEFAGHEPAYAQVVFQKAVYAVYSAGFAAAEDEEVPAGGMDAVALHAGVSGIEVQLSGVRGGSHVDGCSARGARAFRCPFPSGATSR